MPAYYVKERAMPAIIGLTGGIGSGKSYVASLCEQWGASVVDTDVIAHQLTQPAGAAMAAIAQQFGEEYVAADGSMDRARMRELVFDQPEKREVLQNILHPLIRKRTFEEVARASTQAPYVLVVVPLLVESGEWAAYVDGICVVDCDEATQIERVIQRSGLTPAQIQRIMESQATRAQRLAVADYVISNDGSTSLEQLTAQTQQQHQQWLAASSSKTPSKDN